MPNISGSRLIAFERAEQRLKQLEYRQAAEEAGKEIMSLAGLSIADRGVRGQLTAEDKIVLREVRRRVPTAYYAWAQLTNPKLNEIGGLS